MVSPIVEITLHGGKRRKVLRQHPLGVRLGWVGAAVMERLRHEGEGILPIFDDATDADALKPYLPKGGAARVLVTSNTHA